MPFVDLSPNGDQEYFSDGIAEELLNILSRVEGLRVAARTSSFAFKSKEPSVQEIGRALGVATILEGSVRKEGDRVKIAVQLVDTNDGFFIWSQSYQRELSSILTVQDEIGRSIAKALEIELIGEQGTGSPATKRAAIPLAYDQYLKGLAAFRRNSFEALEESVEHFETVIRLDPLFAQAYNALARSKLVQLATGSVTDKDQLAQAERLALKALAIDPDDGAPHTTLGEIYRQKGLSKESHQQYLEALRLSPNNIQAMVALASTYNTIDQRQQALDLFQQALRADPFNPDVHMKYGHILIQLGQTEQALKSFDWAVEQSPKNPNYRWMIGGLMLRETSDISSAIQHMQAAARLDPDDYEIQAFVGMSYLVLEAVDQAKPYIDRALLVNQNSSVVQTALAYYLLLTGQKDKALQVSMETLLDENMRFTQGTAYDLMGIAVNELLERGDISAAENLVSETNPNYSTFLQTTGINPFTQNMINGMAKDWVLARANVFKAAGQISALEGELDLLQPAGLASTSNFRERLLSSDYLTEAEIRALRDDEEGALEMLEKAVAKGFRYTWHITIANNYAFKRLRNHERFKALLQRIRKDLDVQLALLDSV
jgi:TolB-like protein/Flp pilus assembly protein TadD